MFCKILKWFAVSGSVPFSEESLQQSIYSYFYEENPKHGTVPNEPFSGRLPATLISGEADKRRG